VSTHSGLDLTDAIVALLEGGGLLVGRGAKPDGGGWQGAPGESPFTPYVDVHPVPGGVFDGSLEDPYTLARTDYIIRSFGGDQRQCEWMNDRVHALLVSARLSMGERRTQTIRPDVAGGAVRDDTVQPPIWFAPARWRVLTN